jgi:tight adherence protein C
MNSYLILRVAIAASLMLLASGGLLLRHTSRQRRLNTRFARIHADGGITGTSGSTAKPVDPLKMISGMGQGILSSGVVSSQSAATMQKNLVAAGVRNPNAVASFVAAKIILAIMLPVFAYIVFHNVISTAGLRNLIIGAAAVMGLLIPDYVVKSLRKRYQTALSAGLPDALDMMVMCAESGLTLEPTILRVGTEIHPAHPTVGTEFLITASELQISSDSIAVLTTLGERTDMADIKRIVATLNQTLQYGTPLAEALRVLAAEMRTELLTKFEERAARLPVLLTLPMILCILPSLFLVVGGPAVLQAIRIFSGK